MEFCLANFDFLLTGFRDNVVWDEIQEQQAKENVEKNSCVTFTEDESLKFEEDADQYWNSFYDIHQNK